MVSLPPTISRNKSWDIADNLTSFAGSSSASPSWYFTYYLNICDSNYGALGCLRPNIANGKWNGEGDGYGGWGIITIDANYIVTTSTNIQIIETATLVAGKNTGYASIDRDDLINYNTSAVDKLEKEEYAYNGGVANFINRFDKTI